MTSDPQPFCVSRSATHGRFGLNCPNPGQAKLGTFLDPSALLCGHRIWVTQETTNLPFAFYLRPVIALVNIDYSARR